MRGKKAKQVRRLAREAAARYQQPVEAPRGWWVGLWLRLRAWLYGRGWVGPWPTRPLTAYERRRLVRRLKGKLKGKAVFQGRTP